MLMPPGHILRPDIAIGRIYTYNNIIICVKKSMYILPENIILLRKGSIYMKKLEVPVDRELNALIEYDEAFRFILSHDDLSKFNKGFVNWHKQPTIEISIVTEGAVSVYVLEQNRTVCAGDGFFILPGYLHSVKPAPGYETARYYTLFFFPDMLYGRPGSFFDTLYYRPFVNSGAPLFTFSGAEPWAEGVTERLGWIAARYPDTSPAFRLQTQRIIQDAWIEFAGHMRPEAVTSRSRDTRKILELIEYLHSHYGEKFVLQSMADSVSLSRSECCRYFRQMMHMTITEYLLEYRLTKAAELLKSSRLSVTEIADRTGFCDVSYFIKIFRRTTGITPKAYAALNR